MNELISFRTIKRIILSFFSLRPLGSILYIIQVMILFFLARACTLDLFDLSLELPINEVSLGARFLTRVFQVYLFKATLRRVADILGFTTLFPFHYLLVFFALYGPVMLGQPALFIIGAAIIPAKDFSDNNRIKISSFLRSA